MLSDAGVAQLEPGSEWLAEVLQIGAIKGPHPLTSDDVATGTYAIRMRGARSGLTGGILEAIGVTRGTGTTARADLIIVRPNPNPKTAGMDPETDDTDVYVGQHGDSGAAYVNDANEVVGIHVTHDEAGADGLGRGAAIPIEAVFTSSRPSTTSPWRWRRPTRPGTSRRCRARRWSSCHASCR